MLERYGNTGEKGMKNTMLLCAQDKWLHALAGQHSKQRIIKEDGEPQETASAVLLPEVKCDETTVVSEVGYVQGLPMPRHPADGVLVKARLRRMSYARRRWGAAYQPPHQHARRMLQGRA